MKKNAASKTRASTPDDIRPEYNFDYRQARPNRFAGRTEQARVVVTLDPDLAEVFTTSKSVNTALRALIRAIPHSAR